MTRPQSRPHKNTQPIETLDWELDSTICVMILRHAVLCDRS